MLFSIFAYDIEDSLPLRQAARPAHVARLEELYAQGRLMLAGPNPNLNTEGFSGSLIVAEFDNFEDANKWAETDPYMLEGVYDYVDVKPFKLVFPK
ncbi:MAG: YciI family protein [Thiomicrospira sp.]|uniref:YciI family protein n=1 Tax=Thiomicrospira sp. TaxID=935 RepID=UPI0019DF2FF0|nr:YciI family protein [Thiomicrospira sp.]MBE0493902.1 YciI family protein [Thiomicrospira sp.]